MKTCTKCKENKPLDCYYPRYNQCKVCRHLQMKKYRAANREKRSARDKKQYKANREKENARCKRYGAANRDKRNARDRLRYKTDPVYAITRRLRRRIAHWLKGKKSAPTQKLIGCTFEECNRWIECQFVDGMSWENRDKWHIDHMMPLKTFNVLDPEQQRIACHYTNLQPLWGPENLSQGSKIVYDMIWREHWYIKIDGEYISRCKSPRSRSPRSN